MDLKIVFLAGLTLTFGYWVYTANADGKLHSRIMETTMDQASPAPHQDALEGLSVVGVPLELMLGEALGELIEHDLHV